MSLPPVGFVDLASYVPERFVSSEEISEASGIPTDVLVERFGIRGKHVAREDEHVSDMCISAARDLVETHGPEEIDAVVYFGSHFKDYLVWQAAPKIQHALGIEGFSLETINVSCGAPAALKVTHDMLAADESLRSLLLVGASKESHLLDYQNPRSRFMFNFGDGAVAAILRRNQGSNVVLATSLHTDGSFADHVRVSGGGSVHPADAETVAARMHFLDVFDGEEMKRRLDPITIKNFVLVARDALERGGLDLGDVDILLPIHMKRSIFDALLTELGLEEDQAVYLDTYGHMSAVDPLLGLSLARDQGRLGDGDVALLLAAGTGYTWGAAVVQWGER